MSTPSKTLNDFLYSPAQIAKRRQEAFEAEQAEPVDRELSPETRDALDRVMAHLRSAGGNRRVA